MWGVRPEVRREKESGEFSQLSVFSAGMLAEAMRLQQSRNCIIGKHAKY